MTELPTPEQIAWELDRPWVTPHPAEQYLKALREHGYILVHPDNIVDRYSAGPRLGFATNRELIKELHARWSTGSTHPDYSTVEGVRQ